MIHEHCILGFWEKYRGDFNGISHWLISNGVIRSLIKGLGRQTRENLFLFNFQLHRVYPRKMQISTVKGFLPINGFHENAELLIIPSFFPPSFSFFLRRHVLGRVMINLEDSNRARNWKYSIEISRTLSVQFKFQSILHEISNFQGFIRVEMISSN